MADQPINETDYIKNVQPEKWVEVPCAGDWNIAAYTEEYTGEYN